MFNPGEMSAGGATGYLQNITLPGYYAQQLKGAVILLEHRYWGESIPVETLTAETLQYLNLPNSVSDLTYFAKNVDCQFCEGSTCNSDENPWVLMGGSYSGALAAWTSQLDPGKWMTIHGKIPSLTSHKVPSPRTTRLPPSSKPYTTSGNTPSPFKRPCH